jgi:hypothetical protein
MVLLLPMLLTMISRKFLCFIKKHVWNIIFDLEAKLALMAKKVMLVFQVAFALRARYYIQELF